MSPKAAALSLLTVAIVVGVGPTVPDLAAQSGILVPHWIKFACALFLAICTYVFANLPALRKLATSTGNTSGGSPGVTLGGSPSKPPPPAAAAPPSPPTAPRVFLRLAVFSAGAWLVAWALTSSTRGQQPRAVVVESFAAPAGCNNPHAGAIVSGGLGTVGQCIVAAALSGTIDFADPGQAALEFLAQCAGVTAGALVAVLEELLAPPDGGASLGLPAPVADPLKAKLQAVLEAARKLDPGTTHLQAMQALGLVRGTP